MFREDDAKTMEYAHELFDYYRTGRGYEINYLQSCNLYKEIVARVL
jgi:hypothetical protein